MKGKEAQLFLLLQLLLPLTVACQELFIFREFFIILFDNDQNQYDLVKTQI